MEEWVSMSLEVRDDCNAVPHTANPPDCGVRLRGLRRVCVWRFAQTEETRDTAGETITVIDSFDTLTLGHWLRRWTLLYFLPVSSSLSRDDTFVSITS